MRVPIKDIIVKKRIRKDFGDIGLLAESMKGYGQISPIVLTKNNELIAGGRRLEAAKRLGWKTIDAIIFECSTELEKLELEVEENIQRRDFNMDEVAEASKKIYNLKNPSIFSRIIKAICRFFRKIFKKDAL